MRYKAVRFLSMKDYNKSSPYYDVAKHLKETYGLSFLTTSEFYSIWRHYSESINESWAQPSKQLIEQVFEVVLEKCL